MVDLDSLNKEQKEAANATEGPLLILAGAGSGKTRVLTYRIANLIEKGVYPGSILAITFTNKAAKEMKERVERLVGEEASSMWITTFHSACVRMLHMDIEKLGYSKNFVIYDSNDQERLVKDCLKELNIDEKVFPPKDVMSKIGDLKDNLVDDVNFAKTAQNDFRRKKLSDVYTLYQKKLKQSNALDFDDIIMKTVKLLKDNEDVLGYYERKFRYIMVDEYQDTNKAQYELIRILSERHQNLCVVGDDDQSIYGWRGADIRNILEFEKDYSNVRTIKLEQNYRSTKRILEAANCVIANNSKRKNKKLWTQNVEGEKIKFYKAQSDRQEASFILNEIRKKSDLTGDYSGYAILYRNNAMSRIIEEEFVKAGIPYRVVGGFRFYERKEVRDILSYLKVINNPFDSTGLERIINVPKRGIGDTTVDKYKQYAAENDISLFEAVNSEFSEGIAGKRAAKLTSEFMKLMKEFMDMAETTNVSELIEKIIDKTGYVEELQKEDNPENNSRIENIQEFYSSAVQFEKESDDKSLFAFLERVALVSDQDSIKEGGGVTLMTLHTAKGLEYPTVFIAGMEEGIFPHFSSREDGNRMEEERRLAYVGITRAMSKLYITCARERMMFGRTTSNLPSSFIDEIPDDLIEDISESNDSYNRIYGYDNGYAKPYGGRSSGFGGGSGYSKGGFGGLTKTAAQTAAPKISEIKAGIKIKHKMFGKGIVIAVKESKGDKVITVQFDTMPGLKNFLLSDTPLEIV